MGADYLEAYLVFEGPEAPAPPIQGETTDQEIKDQGYESAIEILSFELGATTDIETNRLDEEDQQFSAAVESSDLTDDNSATLQGMLDAKFKISEHGGSTPDKLLDTQIITVTKWVDKSSPTLLQAYCSTSRTQEQGGLFRYTSAHVVLRRGGEPRYVLAVYTFSDVFIESYSLKTEAEKRPIETIKIGFRGVHISYWPQKADGTPGAMVEMSFYFK